MIANSKTSQIGCIVGLKRGQNVEICDILLFEITLIVLCPKIRKGPDFTLLGVGMSIMFKCSINHPILITITSISNHTGDQEGGRRKGGFEIAWKCRGAVKLDSMWQHRLTQPLHVQHTYYRIIYKQIHLTLFQEGFNVEPQWIFG